MMDFIDLKKQQELIRKNIDYRISKVLNHGQYILGPEVKELENELSLFSNATIPEKYFDKFLESKSSKLALLEYEGF